MSPVWWQFLVDAGASRIAKSLGPDHTLRLDHIFPRTAAWRLGCSNESPSRSCQKSIRSKDHPPWASYDSNGSPSTRVDKLQKSLSLWDIGLPAWECSVPSKVRQKHQDKLRTLGEEFKTLILIAGRVEVTYYHLVYSVQLNFEDQISALLFLH